MVWGMRPLALATSVIPAWHSVKDYPEKYHYCGVLIYCIFMNLLIRVGCVWGAIYT